MRSQPAAFLVYKNFTKFEKFSRKFTYCHVLPRIATAKILRDFGCVYRKWLLCYIQNISDDADYSKRNTSDQ